MINGHLLAVTVISLSFTNTRTDDEEYYWMNIVQWIAAVYSSLNLNKIGS